jgi:pheromone shutdown-related protein TraB
MSEQNIALPQSVTYIKVDDREVYLVGTAHVSKQSVEDVKTTIQAVQPDTVAVELCEPRYTALTNKDNWKNTNIFKIIREKKAIFFLAQLVMSSFYRKLGQKLGVQPGAEMLEGIQQAKNINAKLVLADRKIEITLKRVWGYLGFWNKMKLMTELTCNVFTTEEINEELVENMKNKDQFEAVMAEFASKFPEIKHRLLDERDIYLAQKIRQAEGKKIVAVVGAGHVPGIKEYIHKDVSLDEITQLPPKSIWPTIIGWSIPALIIAMLVYGFFKYDTKHAMENIYIWILVTGSLSAAGAAAAFAHPLAIIISFLAAPITTLHPLLAAGWFAGLAQAWVKKPTVEDFENLAAATSSIKGFWDNKVTRILLVIVLSNLGACIGMYIATSWIAKRSF